MGAGERDADSSGCSSEKGVVKNTVVEEIGTNSERVVVVNIVSVAD